MGCIGNGREQKPEQEARHYVLVPSKIATREVDMRDGLENTQLTVRDVRLRKIKVQGVINVKTKPAIAVLLEYGVQEIMKGEFFSFFFLLGVTRLE